MVCSVEATILAQPPSMSKPRLAPFCARWRFDVVVVEQDNATGGAARMSKNKVKFPYHGPGSKPQQPAQVLPSTVDSLLDNIEDGNEYGSIVSLNPKPDLDVSAELVRAIHEVEAVRGRPCISYLGNVVNGDGSAGIDTTDDLPFHELVARVPQGEKKVDVIVSTNGGSAHQVSRFVDVLRSRFDEVDFLVPSFCMSAGTILVLSGDRIWMTARACLGPIDPQVPSKDGRLVPAQALLLLVQELEKSGREAMAKGGQVPWTAVRLIDSIDHKELAAALTASSYAVTMVTEFVKRYKFKTWTTHSTSQVPVSDQEKEARAKEIASALSAHSRWKSHGHAISRELLFQELKLLIDHTDSVPELDRALRRAWALCTWIFEKTPVVKVMASSQYRHIRQRMLMSGATP